MRIKKSSAIFLGIFLFFIILIPLAFYLFFEKPLQQKPPEIVPTVSPSISTFPTSSLQATTSPQPAVPFTRDPQLDALIPTNILPSQEELTSQEKTYPTAQLQTFPDKADEPVGTLVVTADTDNVRVILDEQNATEGTGQTIPYNTTPFITSTLPNGYYMITASKENYQNVSYMIRIDPGKITRLPIHLEPVDTTSGN